MSRVSGKPYCVYVLWSPAGRRFHIGLSEDPQKRLAQHNQGDRGWTARYAAWKLVYSERCEDYAEDTLPTSAKAVCSGTFRTKRALSHSLNCLQLPNRRQE
jgi:hypothetical protein